MHHDPLLRALDLEAHLRVLTEIAVHFVIMGDTDRGEAVRPLPDVLNHQAHEWFVRDGDVQPVNTAEHRNDFLNRLHGVTPL